MPYTYKIQHVHISQIRVGDVVEHHGKHHTVCPRDLKRDPFMGRTLFGDTYHAGHKKVARVEITHVIPKKKDKKP